MNNLLTVQESAQILGIKPLELFKFLRTFGYTTASNLPHNQYLSMGYFEIQHKAWVHPREGLQYNGRTYITKKGLAHLDTRLREQKAARICRRDSESANDSGTPQRSQESA